MPATITVHDSVSDLLAASTLLVIGRKEELVSPRVRALLADVVPMGVWTQMIESTDPGDAGRAAITHVESKPHKVVAGVLPEVCSRHNTPSRAWAIPGLVGAAGLGGHVGILCALADDSHALANAVAVARAHPIWTGTSKRIEREVDLAFIGSSDAGPPLDALRAVIDAVRLAGSWVDQPPAQLNPTSFVDAARGVAERTQAELEIFAGSEVQIEGLGGLWAVGCAAENPPAMVVLDLNKGAKGEHMVWVGKGITYDTGGLSIKSKTGMPGMKTDMAGAAACLAAFEAAARIGVDTPLTCILCIAENAVGPMSTRPDDILTMHSGRTVEVNNTDAEGRLVLADGVSWAVGNRDPDVLIDMATLTGAQSTSTGKKTAALYCNDDALEARAVRAGRASGDLAHPLPYIPEFFRREFSSPVADMKNSVKDRSNGQSSCAGQFINNHLAAVKFDKPWLHVDMAAPAVSGGRGTGYGVALLLELIADLSARR